MSADDRIVFLETLAQALAPLGQTSAELEDQLGECARGLGLEVRFLTLPTNVLIRYDDGHERGLELMSIGEGSVDLEALALLQQVAVDVGKGRLSPAEGTGRVRALVTHPPRFPALLRVLAAGLAAFAFALLLGGGSHEVVAAVPCGLAVGVFMLVGTRFRRLQGLLEISAAAFATTLALLLGHVVHKFDSASVVLAALVLLLPGLRITMGVSELSAGQVVSGSSRLAGAMMTLLDLSIGVAIVAAVFAKLDFLPPQGHQAGSSTAAQVLAVFATAVAYTVVQNARRRDVLWVLLAVAIAVAGSRFGAGVVGSTLGVGVGSLCVGLAGNLYSRYLRHPKSTMTVPGLTVLVPGALGLQGAFTLVSGGTASGAQLVVNAVLLAAALVVGLMIAESVVPPRTLPEHVAAGDALPAAGDQSVAGAPGTAGTPGAAEAPAGAPAPPPAG